MSQDLPQLAQDVAREVQAAARARWEVASADTLRNLQEQVVLGVLGPASAGKDAAVRALFGVDFGQVDPIPGSTDRVQLAPIDPDGRLLVLNAPGFGDLRAEVEAEARRAVDRLDLALFILNADGGATVDERRDLDAVRATGRPVLVCLNKIDLIRPHQREAFIEATLRQLGVERSMAVATAFDPLPQLAESPIGLVEVATWIHRHLEAGGKGLIVARHLRDRAAASEAVLRAAARRAALAGALPVPGADLTAVSAVQVKLISDLAALYGRRMDQELVLFLLGEMLAGGSKSAVRWVLETARAAGFVPGGQVLTLATSALGASLASAATWGVGRAAIAWFEREGRMTGPELREVFDAEANAFRRVEG